MAWVQDLDVLELYSGEAELTSECRPNLGLNPYLTYIFKRAWSPGRCQLKARSPQFRPHVLETSRGLQSLGQLELRQWYDIAHRGPRNDVCSVLGFTQAIRDTLRLRRGATLFAGLPCSSLLVTITFHRMVQRGHDSQYCKPLLQLRWVWMSTGSTMRHVCVLGDQRDLAQQR